MYVNNHGKNRQYVYFSQIMNTFFYIKVIFNLHFVRIGQKYFKKFINFNR